MTAAGIALVAALGTALIVDGASRRRFHRPTDRRGPPTAARAPATIRSRELLAVSSAVAVGATVVSHALFGGVLVAAVLGAFAATFPAVAHHSRERRRRAEANESWPRVIEDIRVHTCALGRSVPRALFEAGDGTPDVLRDGFEAAKREWQLTTDFERALSVLREQLADPTADMACETLLVAHEVGGTDLDRRLASLAADRFDDVQHRKDARARLASARFARGFVLLVPAGMALAGTSVGNGAAAYRSTSGQVVVLVAVALVIACWWWSGRLLRIPRAERVFAP